MKKILFTLLAVVMATSLVAYLYIKSEKETITTPTEVEDKQIINDNELNTDNQIEQEDNSSIENDNNIFSLVVEEIFLGQKGDFGSSRIVYFEKELPTTEQTYAIHQGDLYIFVKFKANRTKLQIDDLLGQIEVNGEENLDVKVEQNYDQYQIDVNGITEKAIITFGDIPSITIERKEPLRYTLTQTNTADRRFLFTNEYAIPILLVPSDEKEITLEFSEAMDTNKDVKNYNNEIIGKWIDEKSLKLNLEKVKSETDIILDGTYSIGGNYLTSWNQYLHIQKVEPKEWRVLLSGEEVGWGNRVRYYDKILYSPTNDKFIGIIDLGIIDGDGTGTNYSFVLEQKNWEPIIFEEYYYTNFDILGFPIQWINENELIYGGFYEIFTYNILTREKKSIFKMGRDAQTGVHQMMYDKYQDILYLLLRRNSYDENTKAGALLC